MGFGRNKLLIRVVNGLNNVLVRVGIGLNKLLVRDGSDKLLVMVKP